MLRENCMTNTDKLATTLRAAGVREGAVVYVVGGYRYKTQKDEPGKLKNLLTLVTNADMYINYSKLMSLCIFDHLLTIVMINLVEFISHLRKFFVIVFKEDVLGTSVFSAFDLVRDRELLAAVDYEVCRHADLFIGNSVSSFSAMLLLARERSNALQGTRYLNFNYNSGGKQVKIKYFKFEFKFKIKFKVI
jgi:hypothetical protein